MKWLTDWNAALYDSNERVVACSILRLTVHEVFEPIRRPAQASGSAGFRKACSPPEILAIISSRVRFLSLRVACEVATRELPVVPKVESESNRTESPANPI